jgi:hypothetical protein
VTKLFFFGVQIGSVVFGRRDLDRDTFNDLHTVLLEASYFPRVVGEQPY